MTLEIVLMWVAVTVYAAGSVLFAVGLIFHRRLMGAATWVSMLGMLPHAAAIVVRWERVGHAPYIGFYEVVSSLAIICVAAFGLLAWRWRNLEVLGVVIMPLSFLMTAGAMLAPKTDLVIPPKLASWWLTIHVSFAKLSYAALVVSFALALFYLVRERKPQGFWSDVLGKLPSQEAIEDLEYKFMALGFILWGVMIASGAIWANEAWGRYWGWDPVETWSLISWLVYAICLHLRYTMGWHGRKAAWLAVAALPIVVFSLLGVPIVYATQHGAYIRGY